VVHVGNQVCSESHFDAGLFQYFERARHGIQCRLVLGLDIGRHAGRLVHRPVGNQIWNNECAFLRRKLSGLLVYHIAVLDRLDARV